VKMGLEHLWNDTDGWHTGRNLQMHTTCWLGNWRARDPMGDLAVSITLNVT
jgi:hypothetical protein